MEEQNSNPGCYKSRSQSMEKVFTVQIPHYRDHVLQSLHKLQQCGVCCDTTLRAKDGDVRVHSIIIVANSKLHTLVTLNESPKCSKTLSSEVDCGKYNLGIVKAVIVLLYTGEIVIEEKCIAQVYSLCKDLKLYSALKALQEHYPNLFEAFESNDVATTFENSAKVERTSEERNERYEEMLVDVDKDSSSDDEDILKSFKERPQNVNTINEGEHMFLKIDDGKSTNENVALDIDILSCLVREDDKEDALPEISVSNENKDKQLKCKSNTLNRYKTQVAHEGKKSEDIICKSSSPERCETHADDTDSDEIEDNSKDRSASKRKTIRVLSANKHSSINHTDNLESSRKNLPRLKRPKGAKSVKEPVTKNKSKTNNSDDNASEVQAAQTKKKEKTGKSPNKRKKTTETDIPSKKVKKRKTTKTDREKGEITEGSEAETSQKEKKKHSYKCVQCNIVFPTYSERSVHMREIHKPFTCSMCGWVGVHPYQYASHMYGQHKVVINPERYPLVECPEEGCTYKSLSCSMNDHRRSHKFKVDKLVCHVCGMEFSSSTGLLVHSSYHKEADMKYKCRQCSKVFGWRHELNKHMTAEHNTYKLCHICPFKAKSKTSLVVHLHNVHGEPIPAKMKKFECDCCDFYCFYPSYLKIHKQENHSDVMNFKCSDCPKEFKTKKSLRSHREHTHSTNFYYCDKCDYKTRTLSTLQTHEMSTHSELRPFSCHLCSYSCKLRGNLNSHLKNIHKVELVSTAQLREKMVKTGKGFNEYLDARRNLTDSERRGDLTLRTRPVSDGPDSSDDRVVDNFRDQYPDFMSAIEPTYLQLR